MSVIEAGIHNSLQTPDVIMLKKITNLAGVLAALVVASPAQAQFIGFTTNNDGAEFWDNVSADGRTCNIGYVVTGVAGSTGNSCSYQRPKNWLPYTGPAMNSFWASPTFTITGGSLTFDIGKGVGGDVAGADYDWGFWVKNGSGKTFTSLNGYTEATAPVVFNFAQNQVWGFWMNNGALSTSDLDSQFALFLGANNEAIVGIEDTQLPGGDRDYQDMIASVKITGTVPEPSSALLLMGGLAGLAGVARRRKA